jgi:type VI secretion system secreted protein Hcp
MRTNQVKMKMVAVLLIVGAVILIAFNAGGGSLEPNAPPGPTMHTLEDIYNAVGGGSTITSAVDYFLKIDGIEGESTDDKHKDWIDILSFSHGVSQPITSSDTGERIAQGCDHQDFSIVKVLDKASPKLALYCCAGKHIPKVELEMRKVGEELEYMKITMEDLLISSIQPQGSVSDVLPLEEVSFNYAKIEWDYRVADGNSIYTGWDVNDNTPIDPCGYLNLTP